MSDRVPEVEAELEAFRQRWREEVSARNKRPAGQAGAPSSGDKPHLRPTPVAGSSTARRKEVHDYSEEFEPRAYHDLPDKEEALKLGSDGVDTSRRDTFKEPSSALEHYEHAVEREAQGNLGESIRHYRKAFKLDDGVHEAYKRKHFPPSSFAKPKPTGVNPSNAAVTVPNPAHHSLHGGGGSGGGGGSEALPKSLKQLIDGFSHLRIEPAEPATSASPQQPCPLGELPEEILSNILLRLAVADVASFARLAQVCRRLAHLVLTEERIWKRVAEGSEFGFGAMHYAFACEVSGNPLEPPLPILPPEPSSSDPAPLPSEPSRSLSPPFPLPSPVFASLYNSSYRSLFRSRPRLRFNGCYISTVNYTRAGATGTNTLTWGLPVHVVTYFRYLRFLRDGTAISLLTTAEPADVVHHLTPRNLHANHGNSLPSSVMRDALRGRWRLSGPEAGEEAGGEQGEREREGEVVVETEGVVPRYTYKMVLALANAGKGARNNKLAWKGFWSYNKLTDDWGEFGLRNDRAFYWSRVRSYGMGGGV